MSKKLLFNFNREVVQDYTYIKYSGTIITATNTLEKPIKGAILKGSTKYRDIDTGEFLETFEEGRNLELVSVKMPVLTTSNEDGTKTNILSTSEDVTLRGIGDVQDTLDCLTGELTQRMGKWVLDGNNKSSEFMFITVGTNTVRFEYTAPTMKTNRPESTPIACCNLLSYKTIYNTDEPGFYVPASVKRFVIRVEKSNLTSYDLNGLNEYFRNNNLIICSPLATETVKTVDLSILDQNENKVSSISSFNDTTHIMASSETIPPIFEGYLATKEVE